VGVVFEKFDKAPCWVLPYMFSEYTPVMKVRIIRDKIKKIDMAKVAVINMISLSRLIDGGAAMLIAVNMNHHIDMFGLNTVIPFIRNILRVCRSS
jgi:hypothetical protein